MLGSCSRLDDFWVLGSGFTRFLGSPFTIRAPISYYSVLIGDPKKIRKGTTQEPSLGSG